MKSAKAQKRNLYTAEIAATRNLYWELMKIENNKT